MSLWELNVAIDGWQEVNGGESRKNAALTEDEIVELEAVIDRHYGD